MTASLALVLVLAQSSAPSLQAVWTEFERTKLPGATASEDTTELDDRLSALKAAETGCLARLARQQESATLLGQWRADREKNGLELDPAALEARVKAHFAGQFVLTPPDEARQVTLTLKGDAKAPYPGPELKGLANALPSLEFERAEGSAAGWTITAKLRLFAPRPVGSLVPDAPAKSKVEGRRSSELRLRLAAARPGVVECERRLQSTGLSDFDWYEQTRAAYDKLPKGGPLLPTLTTLSAIPRPQGLLVEIATPETFRVALSPAAAVQELRARMRTDIGRALVGEVEAEGTTTLTFVLERPLEAVVADEQAPTQEALARFVGLVKELMAPRWREVRADDAALAKAGDQLLASARDHWPFVRELASFGARRELFAGRIAAQGVGVDPVAAAARLKECGVELSGAVPAADGQPHALELKGPPITTGPHPLACAREKLGALRIARFERSTKGWKVNATLTLDKVRTPAAGSQALPPAPPEVPGVTTRIPAGAAYKTRLAELAAAITDARAQLGKLALGETSALATELERLAGAAVAARTEDAFAEVVFADMSRCPLWMDFYTKAGGSFDLNLAPKDKAEGLIKALAPKCPVTKQKVAGDSIRATVTCRR